MKGKKKPHPHQEKMLQQGQQPNQIFLLFKKETLDLYRKHIECEVFKYKTGQFTIGLKQFQGIKCVQKEIQTLVQIQKGQKYIPHGFGMLHIGPTFWKLLSTPHWDFENHVYMCTQMTK